MYLAKLVQKHFGIFNLVMSVYLFAITLATSGLSLACTYLVSEQFENGNFLDGLKAFKACRIFSLILGLGASILVLAFSNFISQKLLKSMISPTPLYIISFGLPFIALSSSLNGYFSAIRKAYKSAIAQIFELIIKIVISILLLNINNNKTIESICIYLILADVISEIFSCFILYIIFKMEKLKITNRQIKEINFTRKILQISFPVCITSYIRSGLSTLKQFIIPNRLALFGLPYAIALSEYGKIDGMTMSILLFPNVFFQSFSRLLIPEFTSLMVKNYKKRILEICKKGFLTISIFSILLSFLFFIFANSISFKIFQNLECGKYIKILSPIILFMYLDNIIDSMLKGLNKQFEVMFCNILDLLLTIAILGLTGYLLSIVISEIFNFTFSYVQLYKAINFKMSHFTIICCCILIILSVYQILSI